MSRDPVMRDPVMRDPVVDTLTGELRLPPVRDRLIRLSVDNARCHLYAICQAEAPEVFEVGRDGRLRYDHTPPPVLVNDALQAARLCPMQAIHVREA